LAGPPRDPVSLVKSGSSCLMVGDYAGLYEISDGSKSGRRANPRLSLLPQTRSQTRQYRHSVRAFGWDGQGGRSAGTHRRRVSEHTSRVTEAVSSEVKRPLLAVSL
jgi:hypothetical protein